MYSARQSKSNHVRFWREPGFANTELLAASYTTHCFPRHSHDELAIGVISRGAQAFQDCRGQRAIMPQGRMCVINPGQVHEGRPATEEGWDYRMAYVPAARLIGMLGEEGAAAGRAMHFPNVVIDDDETEQLFWTAHLCSESVEATQLEKASRLTAAICQAVTRHALPGRDFANLVSVPGAVKRAREYIDAHFAQNPSLEIISSEAGISAYHLLRAFRDAIGVAPHSYLVQRRIERAKNLLLSGQTLRSIAIETGYCDQGHLSRDFKRFYGVPPSAARR
ncbi:AraC family transcriptional regulator [Caballeronia sp. GACF5]|uniref:AraC family transcriptional regulator n=1 Tax=Caballeronia sp. GACF5 TaxID=2921746 RepID=UPI0020286BE3|nr:AraC family transcriptional regulator [Caballeronia sp. GACF5]